MKSNSPLPTYQAIFETCEEGIIVVNSEGRIILANQSSKRLFGYSIDELLALSVDDLLPSSLRKKHAELRKGYSKNPQPRRMGRGRDLQAQKKDGSLFPVEISLNQTFINDDSHTVAFIIDITDRKVIEEALKNSEEQLIVYASELEKRVQARTKELDETIKKLEDVNHHLEDEIVERKKAQEDVVSALENEKELNELKSRFVSMASHEFRTPLSAILSSASLISKYNDPGTEEKRLRHVDKIKSSINNLNNILNDFLSLAKIEEGKTEIQVTEFNISDLANEAINDIEEVLKSGQHVELRKFGTERKLKSDEKLLRNIFINLLSNASKYSFENSKIILDVIYGKNNIDIHVTDQGIGIDLTDQKHLFERFFRAKNATNIQGTGLGLNIVKKHVELLSGSITFESQLNIGTTFKVKLPL
ncbi:PAS domain-containing sensor histidine kinase [Fulvivirga lutimaris]|uniref:sensor histidine kinase n=1 Tax=Fulvivirga lutimaris TaxID=1819566 RepID=UPI0012BB7279|nr:PAS domain-containing sensor histidine kinase [Fulvivirga lutimaris]MTI38670.1 PAS domain S-box protein [Fulvivirga lutimaris]